MWTEHNRKGPSARRARLAAILCTVAALSPVLAGPGGRARVVARLEKILAGAPQSVTVGLLVLDADSGETWFAHQANLPLKPASVLKLCTTTAAIERLGMDFTYRTKLYYRDGELLIVGSGDPALGDERIARRHHRPWLGELAAWAALVERRGLPVRTIAIDDSIFDPLLRHPDWPDEEDAAWYQAPVGGINFNDNCLDGTIRIAGGRAVVDLLPKLPESFYVNRLVVGKKHQPRITRALGQDVFEFRGSVARPVRFKPVSVGRPTVFFGYALQQAIVDAGAPPASRVVRRQITPEMLRGAELLDEHTTPMDDVLWRCNKFSQNLFAECLLKSLAAYEPGGRRSGRAGSWQAGTAILRRTLESLGLDTTGAVFRDGSGLSHKNRVTARLIATLLVKMRHHRAGDAFLASLARPGRPGSMRRRYDTPGLHARLRGKTGTIDGVKTLAGYVQRDDGTTLAFAALGNGGPPLKLLVQLAEALTDQPATTSRPKTKRR